MLLQATVRLFAIITCKLKSFFSRHNFAVGTVAFAEKPAANVVAKFKNKYQLCELRHFLVNKSYVIRLSTAVPANQNPGNPTGHF